MKTLEELELALLFYTTDEDVELRAIEGLIGRNLEVESGEAHGSQFAASKKRPGSDWANPELTHLLSARLMRLLQNS